MFLLRHPGTAAFAAALGITSLTSNAAPAQSIAEQPEKYQWLEEVSSTRAMEWVKTHNETTAKVLEADPRFPALEAAALKVLESPDRLAMPDFREGIVYNTWQDAQHIRGILRRTTLADYRTAQPHWHTVIDYDALGKADNRKWVQKGLACLYPGDGLCLVRLSDGGEDATTMREFDLKSGQFVPNGFVLPTSKQQVEWVDRDTLLLSRDWGPGSMTKSGYAFIVKRWKRGQPLEQAQEVFRGAETDVSAEARILHDAQGNQAVLLTRGINFFTTEYSVLTPAGPKRLALPGKSDLHGMVDGQILLTLNEDWTPDGIDHNFPQGSVLAISLNNVNRDPAHLKPTVIFTPSTQEFAQEVDITRNVVLLTTLDHVQGRAYSCIPAKDGTWSRKNLPVPENVAVDIVSTNTSDDQFILGFTGFLTPSSLVLGDAATGATSLIKTLPSQFEAKNLNVEQILATSKDGTRVPYFVVHEKNLKYDGSNPTLMSAYGGFQVSNTPAYSATLGKLWLERGGVFVLANIRGGGEFGPAWHEAGLKTNRQRIYDDFAAIANDLFTRKITSPRHLGIQGGSNGGLLMGVEMTQHPEMWNAVVIQVPLLDMLRFEQIAAGASWVGEYGSVANPDERRFLASISPYNQLRPDAKYPEPLIFTTTKDDRVGPVHARKFAARMEEMHHPFFYQEITEGGHGSGADLKETARTYATTYTYLTRKLMD